MGRFLEIKDEISNDWKALLNQWIISCEIWHDPIHLYFRKEIWSEFESIIPHYLSELEKLDDIVRKAQREVK
jgi:hypothetical protein